ncbi:DVU0298 family protein [Desulfogranum japonicum]|uniref:DVU0298 family protein n=1 Tax=Desulfogranum japonicum TaxID=231447 RepID=UPI001E653FF7|nr:DVU0298 family protein [Desulfogranum japonicum]
MTEFPMGKCTCGAIYVCDATGHNVGSAMVECLVNACNDESDLAWELVPEEDYLTGRLEDYDDVTHQIIPKRNLDGRAVRGVLFFVRLHKDMAEIVTRFEQNKQQEATLAEQKAGGASLPEIEPARDPKRKKKRASKTLVHELAVQGDIQSLVDYCFDDKRTLRFMQRLLYEPDLNLRNKIIWNMGSVCARVATREPGQVADLLHRLFEACSDSASTSWGMVEAIGAIIACRPDVYGAFTRHLYNFLHDPATLAGVIWGLGEIARSRPDLVRKTPFYSLLGLLNHDDAEVRGQMVRLLGRIQAKEAAFQILPLQQDTTTICIFEQGEPVEYTLADLATIALENIHKGEV